MVADTVDRAEALAALLEEDDRFEISEIERADVLLCLGIALARIPQRGKPVVAIGNGGDGEAPLDGTLKAWLPASASISEIIGALVAAGAGLTVLTGPQARRLFRFSKDEVEIERLTAREQQVLQLMAAGLGNKEIAGRLSISANTSKFHVKQILAKLNAESRTEAVSMAIRRGLIPI
jgi:DNA-binding CsgD family transcriptional regulator